MSGAQASLVLILLKTLHQHCLLLKTLAKRNEKVPFLKCIVAPLYVLVRFPSFPEKKHLGKRSCAVSRPSPLLNYAICVSVHENWLIAQLFRSFGSWVSNAVNGAKQQIQEELNTNKHRAKYVCIPFPYFVVLHCLFSQNLQGWSSAVSLCKGH